MFIFIRLLLAHFIGDFPLQFNKIYKLKFKGPKGIVPHAIIVMISLIAVCWPYLFLPQLWFFILFLGITHLIQDSVKINFGQIKYSFWFYLLDQFMHVGTVALVFLTDLKKIQPLDNTAGFIELFYNNNSLIIYIIALIIASYNGFYLMRTFKSTFWGTAGKFNAFEKWYGMVERAIIVSLFLHGGLFFLLVPTLPLLRPLIFRLWGNKLNLDPHLISEPDILLGWIIAVSTGIALYLLI